MVQLINNSASLSKNEKVAQKMMQLINQNPSLAQNPEVMEQVTGDNKKLDQGFKRFGKECSVYVCIYIYIYIYIHTYYE